MLNQLLKTAVTSILALTSMLVPYHATATESLSIDGLWTDVNTADFTNGTMIIAQDGDAIHVSHYVEYKGIAMVEYGIGSRKGRTLEYKVKVTRPIPGWVEEGRHILILSDDGQRLEGQYQSNTGNGSLVFDRKGK
ncbi:hypothetical protein FM038_021215 [Shewanella eurypsychrophilus]|uniref:Uncharacterized protein n=1 Tax=Shewanella eurypsychrophilus TaxID=2593656 RepID=A0ABX6VA97_9GAMM|nr:MULTISPECIES: hypothetical protein [Shewanella]QFU24415.1 hypothetical protein FS418_22915 [Shewanella sp. YLB-09]QPG59615.1 hypothetical protein FM038_021215 [Shewanella eurypsychrophilus]